MKRLWPTLIELVVALVEVERAAGQATNATTLQFKYELHTALSGALHESANEHRTYVNDLVHKVFVDSKGWVFAGTANGLAVYDGKQWTNRTFKFDLDGLPLKWRAALSLFGSSECGPEEIVEGPPGTIWLGGLGCGVWRFRDGRYDETGASPRHSNYLGMAVDSGGALWVVTRESVHKYDGQSWLTVLSPYLARTVHRELPQLYGVVVATNGSVWIGGTQYGNPEPPREHDGTVWVVDQKLKKRGDGPPMAGLYEFHGSGWRAFGSPHGLGIQSRDTVIPKLDGQGRVAVTTRKGYHVRQGENWKPLTESDVHAGKRWVLRGRSRGWLRGYFTELLFREGERLVRVQPRDNQTGQVLDFRTESLGRLHMAEDRTRECIWLETTHGLYRIWLEKDPKR